MAIGVAAMNDGQVASARAQIVFPDKTTVSAEIADTEALHRIEPASVRKIAEGVGFKFAGESKVLENSADPLDIPVFDKSIRGHTSQFAYKFVKPAS